MTDLETAPLLTAKHQDEAFPQPSSFDPHGFTSPEASVLGRRIGWLSAYILVISRVIGSGIFAMPGTIIQNVGSPGLALILWIVGALVAWAALAIDLEYGCMLPRSGGSKVYLEFTYPRPRFLVSTLYAVQAVLLGFTASNCIVFAKYTLFASGNPTNDLNTKALAVALLTAITIVHSCFYRTGMWIQNILGWLKLGLIGFMIITGFVVLLKSEAPTGHIEEIFDNSEWSLNTLSTALFKIFYSYAGLSNINNVLNEVKNPVRTLKTVGPIALFTACFLYILVNIAYLAVVPLNEIKQSQELIAALYFEKVFGTGFGSIFLPLNIALSAAGNVMVVTFSLARLNQEIARQGFLPFSDVLASSRPFGAPMGGLLVHYIPSVLVIVLPPSSTVYAFIADVEGYAGQFSVIAVAVGLLILRWKKRDLTRPFKAWLPAVWLRILLSVSLIIAPLFPPKSTSDVSFFYATYAIVGTSVLLFGLIYWYVWTVLLPRWAGYRLEEELSIIKDGSAVIKLVKHRI